MIMKRSTYERKMLWAFKKGRESNIIVSENDALKIFADLNGFSTKTAPQPILNKTVFGMCGSGKVSSILVENDEIKDEKSSSTN